MDSQKHKQEIKNALEDLVDNIDNMYFILRNELEEEILQRKEKIEKIDEDTNKIYELLLQGNQGNVLKLIRKSLPVRIRLFNKISIGAYGVFKPGQYFVDFYFNHNPYYSFQRFFVVGEVKEILKYKE
jgi:hypothetical protein